MRSDGEREFIAGQQNAATLFSVQFQMFLELREIGNSVLELPFPIVPEFRCNIRPIPWRMRNEIFSVPILRGKSVHFIVDEKVKTLKNRVNAGTWPCATHAADRLGRAL